MKILLIEDDKVIAGFIEKGLKEAGYGVDVCERGDDGLEYALGGLYDALICDIMLPGMDGLDLIEAFRKRGHSTPVLVLSAKRSVDERVEGFKRGGDDYLTKPFAFSELLVRLQSLLKRSSPEPSVTELTAANLSLNPLTRVVKRGDNVIELQPREYSLLEYLLRNKGTVLTKTLILEHIWDYHFDPQTNVVDVLISRLRSRIDKDYEPKLINTVRGVGYVIR